MKSALALQKEGLDYFLQLRKEAGSKGKLYDYNPPTKPPGTIFLTGAGVVAGAWAPVTKAVKTLFPELPEGEENLAFATEIYQLRQRAAARMGGLRLTGLLNWKAYATIQHGFKYNFDRYITLKKAIARELTFAMQKGELSLRPFLERVRSKYLEENYAVVTTNWDLMLEDCFKGAPGVFHLHGDIMNYHSLYLPSEHSWESYHQLMHPSMDSTARSKITHGNWLAQKAHTIIIAGLSLSPLDAELHSFLFSSLDKGNRPNVIIIDPHPEIVESRLRFHLRGQAGRVSLLTPEQV